MKKIFIGLLVFAFVNNAFAFDPLNTEKHLPTNFYDSWDTDKNSQDCKLPDFSKEKINIYKSVVIGLCRSNELKSSWYSLKQQAYSYGQSESAYFPSINFGGAKNYGKNDSSDNLNYGLSLDWLLFDFGQRGQKIDQQYFSLVSIGYNHNSNITNFVYDVIQSYLNFYSAQESVEAYDISYKAYEKSYNIAKEKYKVGVVPKSDVYNAETQLAQAKLNLYKAQNAVLIEQGKFVQLLNLPQGTEFKLEKPEFIKNVDLIEKNINDLIDEAVKNRSAMASIIAKERSALANAKAQKYSYFPSVSASAGISEVDYDHDDYRDGNDSSISFKVSLPIFTGFSRSYGASRAYSAYEQVKADKENLKGQIAYEVWGAYHVLRNSIQNYETAVSLVKSSKQARDVAQGMYKSGRGNILDLMFLEASYSDALREEINMNYQKLLSQIALLKAISDLNVDFLKNKEDE